MYTQNSYSENLSGRYRGSIALMGFKKEEECLDQLGDFNQEFCSVTLKRDFS
jgi:hypothetical protein